MAASPKRFNKYHSGSQITILLSGPPSAHARNRPTATDEKKKSLLYFGCDFFGWYNFGKIIKTVATRCHILKLKCTKFDFGRGSAPDPLG